MNFPSHLKIHVLGAVLLQLIGPPWQRGGGRNRSESESEHGRVRKVQHDVTSWRADVHEPSTFRHANELLGLKSNRMNLIFSQFLIA